MSETNEIAQLTIKADKNTPASQFSISDGREFILHRADFKLEQITATNAADVHKPKIVTALVDVQDSNSFIDYVNRFSNDDTVIFADMNASVVLGVIDYHQMPGTNQQPQPELDPKSEPDVSAQRDPKPELCAHRIRFGMPHSIEWKTWMQANGKLMSHKDFATFLEENSIDVLPLVKRAGLATSEEDADMPESLLELTRTLQVTNKVNFNSVVRHGDYERIEFAKESDATTKGAIGLPVSFQIRIPVYFGEPPVELTCFTRKKVDDGALSIGFSVNRAENVRQEEFQRIIGVIAAATDLTTLFGKPSA